jgi:hypothetical protein
MTNPIIFLDFDDVLCLSAPDRAGCYDAIHALDAVNSGRVTMGYYQDIWDNLFDKVAVANLLVLHKEFDPRYVLSTSWTRMLDKADTSKILQQCGLSIVVDSLHTDWETKKLPGQSRFEQISAWLSAHRDVENWVALDDAYSGDGFDDSHSRVVMCAVDAGFTKVELKKARSILRGELK